MSKKFTYDTDMLGYAFVIKPDLCVFAVIERLMEAPEMNASQESAEYERYGYDRIQYPRICVLFHC